MGVGNLSQNIGVCDVFDSTAEDGEIRCQLGHRSEGVATDGGSCGWGPDGYLAKPNAFDGTGNTIALYLKDGSRKHVIGFRDSRYAKQAGDLQAGDRAIVTNGEARFVLKKEADSVCLYSVNQKTDESMMVSVGGKDGELLLLNGKSYIRQSTDQNGKAKLTLGCGAAQLVLKEDGTIQFFGVNCIIGTQKGCLGLMSPNPPVMPVAPVQGISFGPGIVGSVPSSSWTVAPV